MSLDFTKLSKVVSQILRHDPTSYNLCLDEDGWVDISNLINALTQAGWSVDISDLTQMVELSDKKRHEIRTGRIRAFYGHSNNIRVVNKEIVNPPEFLYHGTLLSKVSSILLHGLFPMQRQYVHLSSSKLDAKLIAERRVGTSSLIEIRALSAYHSGIDFFKEANGVWLSKYVPSKYIDLI